ncbi:DsbA family protein [Streptomyces aurantiogriseus]|uniref:Alkylmercury lyase n=1 Tax=Streptomyces aurantiogriseus TaxID=66870 RepID=A0A918KV58_9ACTN|nr:DsbA family protein [Streptomyces aurantiogriseus]GGR35335.1 hypothetical protein GCM10010251_59560 [Streptomyces aurantiogriseus]
MEIEVLVVPGFPNEQTVADQLRRALDDIGLRETGFTTRVIADQTEAERDGFTGSPTIFVDGRDLFTEPGRPPGLACRVYRTPHGLASAPDAGQLRRPSQPWPTPPRTERHIPPHFPRALPSELGAAPTPDEEEGRSRTASSGQGGRLADPVEP